VHHERNHIARVLRPVQQTRAALVELLRAIEAATPAMSLGCAFRPFPDGSRSASGERISLHHGSGRVARPFGFALTDPGRRLSRTRLFPEVTRIEPLVASMDE
jgi:hypothetical protein